MKPKRLAFSLALITIIVFSSLLPASNSFAIDYSDTIPPEVKTSLMSRIPSQGNLSVYQIDFYDSANEIIPLISTQGVASFEVPRTTESIAPVCIQTYGLAPIAWQVVYLKGLNAKSPGGGYSTRALLLLHSRGITPLPDGCREWRNWDQAVINGPTLEVKDSALNVNRFELTSIFKEQSPKLATDSKVFCFGVDKRQLPDMKSVQSAYEQLLIRRSSIGGESALRKVILKFPSLPYLETYLKFTSNDFDLQKYLTLPLCNRPNIPESTLNDGLPRNSFIEITTLIVGEVASLIARPRKTFTIKCFKGKLTKQVTGINPKCPSGYKKK